MICLLAIIEVIAFGKITFRNIGCYIIAVVMLRVGPLFRTIISFIENQFLSEQIYDNRYTQKWIDGGLG
jgi:hypothetical protein